MKGGKQFEEGLNSKSKQNLRGIFMGRLVMQELDYCLSLGQEHMA